MANADKNYDDLNREQIKNLPREERKELNADPITGEPGSHPIGTGLGSASGAVAGAAIGSLAGPAGAVVGGVFGAVAGGAIGHTAGEVIDPTVEDAYWRENYLYTPYYQAENIHILDLDYDRDYQSAYRLGYENRHQYPANHRFEDVESDLSARWEHVKGESRLKWEQAKQATRDAWNRLTH